MKLGKKYRLTPDNGYVKVWNTVLNGLIGWTPEQVDKELVQHWTDYMVKCNDRQGGMFYHEGPEYYLWGILLNEWKSESRESIRIYNKDFDPNIPKGRRQHEEYWIKLAASQEEVFEPLRDAYKPVDWLHVGEEHTEPNWSEVAETIKQNIRDMPPFREWKKIRFPEAFKRYVVQVDTREKFYELLAIIKAEFVQTDDPEVILVNEELLFVSVLNDSDFILNRLFGPIGAKVFPDTSVVVPGV